MEECGVCYEEHDRVVIPCCRGIICVFCRPRLRRPECPFCRTEWKLYLDAEEEEEEEEEYDEFSQRRLSRIQRRYLRRWARLRERELDRERNQNISRMRKWHSRFMRIIREELAVQETPV